MDFFFADSLDMIDPSFDFESETRNEWRVRQQDDLYPHEVFSSGPYDGVLISKSLVDGNAARSGKYSLAQRQRIRRVGARKFARAKANLKMMGDCGAFSYVREEYPPFTPDEVIEFYESCGFDYGLSVDHIILHFQSNQNPELPGFDTNRSEWYSRQGITLELAEQFFKLSVSNKVNFTPIGVAQGWSAQSYRSSLVSLQKMGYTRVALGGMVPLKTNAILETLEELDSVRNPDTQLHLLGVTRRDHLRKFQEHGVTSFDSTSPLRQAFMDDKDNFHTIDGTYQAIRVPQVDGHTVLQQQIRAGEIDQAKARALEQKCLKALREYDKDNMSLDDLINTLLEYESLHHPKASNRDGYQRILEQKPWRLCDCSVCNNIGIEVIIFRGSERNKRRGFHNLWVFYNRLHKELGSPQAN